MVRLIYPSQWFFVSLHRKSFQLDYVFLIDFQKQPSKIEIKEEKLACETSRGIFRWEFIFWRVWECDVRKL